MQTNMKNKKKLDLLVMCGDSLRHKYFAIRLLETFPNSAALIERHFEDPTKTYNVKDTSTMRQHFEEFKETEIRYFKEFVEKNNDFLNYRLMRRIPPGTINKEENVEFIKTLNPRAIAIHSTSIIGYELISAFPKRIINLHAGLSPYYRGSGTNVWPFYNKELEFVGMTVHYIDAGIDSGGIIIQGRPQFEKGDNTHTIGCKNVILGTDLIIKVIKKYLNEGTLPEVKQDKTKGRLYLKKQFSDDTIIKIRKNLEEGLVEKYIKNPREVDIVEW